MALMVVRNEIDGWDVVRDDEGVALSNHPTRQQAEAAAKLRAREEHISEPVVVAGGIVHHIDDTRMGMRTAVLALGGLLLAVTILVVVLALTGSLTGFGS
jgi:Uncharacterized protein conserved in bacteria (DUF2188)